MPSTDGPESYSAPMFPGDILLIKDVRNLKLFDPVPPLCGVARAEKVEEDRPKTPLVSDGTWSIFLAKEPHEWLMDRGWYYAIILCEQRRSVILELEDPDRALMFKLTWAGMETSAGV